jgi:hypothetical protein
MPDGANALDEFEEAHAPQQRRAFPGGTIFRGSVN